MLFSFWKAEKVNNTIALISTKHMMMATDKRLAIRVTVGS